MKNQNQTRARPLVDMAIRVEVEEETPRADVPLSVCVVNSISKAKKNDPPLLKPRCSADVLY